MFAILFISIGLFAYVALHTRILHSGARLKDLELERRKVATLKSIDQTRAMYGEREGVLWTPFPSVDGLPLLKMTTTTFVGDPPVPVCPCELEGLSGSYEVDTWTLQGVYDASWPTE